MADKPIEKQKSEQELANEFITAYTRLCEEHQMRIVVTPVFTSTNHGTFEVALQQSVGRIPKQTN